VRLHLPRCPLSLLRALVPDPYPPPPMPYSPFLQCGRLAQLGEHLPYKEGVTGSRPVSPTPIVNGNEFLFGRLAQLGEHLPYKEGVTGSRPVSPTILSFINISN